MLFFIALIYLQACFVTAITPPYAARHSPDIINNSRSTSAQTTIIQDTRSTTVTCFLSSSKTSPTLLSTPLSSVRGSPSLLKGTRSVTRTRKIQLHTASPSSTISFLRTKVPFSTTTATELVPSVNTIHDTTTKATVSHLGSAESTSLLASTTSSGHSNDVSNAGISIEPRFRTRAIIGLGCIWGIFGFL